jgi:histidyl-tRNA synthetase
MIAGKRRELSLPLRWYSIPNAFRYERPQRGRVREHWQLNADLFGAEGIEADAEIITLAYSMLKKLDEKITDSDFEIKINFAGVLARYLTEKFELNDEKVNPLVKVIDRYGKISDEDFEKRARDIIGDKTLELLDILKKNDINEFDDYEEIKYLEELKNKLDITVTIDPFLTRGFDYYTGIVFEVYDTNPENNRSVFGGGRYDNILEIFDAEKVPAIGFGMGDVPVKNFLEVRGLIPEYVSTTDLMLCTLSKDNIPFAQGLANKLRSEGLNVAVNLTDKKIEKQLKTADKQSIPFVICIGEEEEKTGKFKLKELKTSEEKEVTEEEIKDLIF